MLYTERKDEHVSPETALRIAAALGTSPELWLNLEADFRLALARQESAPTVLHDIAQRSAQLAQATA